MTWYDCSPPIDESLPVWPGDEPYRAAWNGRLENGDGANFSSVQCTLHLGSHVDAPFHASARGAKIDELPIELFVGPARVILVPPGILTADRRIPALAADGVALRNCPPRVLFRTETYQPVPPFAEDFAGLSPELIDALAQAGVRLAGIDTPSVDPFADEELASHHRLIWHGMVGLEGLVLGHVPAGDYELIALPLRFMGRDGSPVRAVLRSVKS